MEYVTLNNGVKMPKLGYGVFQMTDLDEAEKAVLTAIHSGYRLIDTASRYYNEEAVGKAIKKSGVPRDELFITTKLWFKDAGYEKTKQAFQVSLDKLGLNYLDLYLIHQPYGDAYGSWRAMEEFYKEGRIRAIGVSNFYSGRLVDFIQNNEVAPAVAQRETHPFNQQWGSEEWMRKYNVQLEAWSPFGRGKVDILENEVLKEIAFKYHKSVAQVILRWFMQRNVVSIPKAAHLERMQENLDIFDFALSNEDMMQIKDLDRKESIASVSHEDPEMIEFLSKLE